MTLAPCCYRFPDRATWLAQGKAAGLLDAAGEPTLPEGAGLYEVGQVEVCAADGSVIAPITFHPGWHVNLLHPDPPASLDPWLVVVSSARCIWGGWPSQTPDDATLAEIAALP